MFKTEDSSSDAESTTADSSPTYARTPCGNLAVFEPLARVGAIELGPSDSDVVESPIARENVFELPSTNESPETDLTAAFAAIAPEKKTTLGRKRRKQVMEGLENLGTHDHCVQYLCGLKSIDANPPTVCIITDHPSVFQETGFDVMDAGSDCGNFEGTPRYSGNEAPFRTCEIAPRVRDACPDGQTHELETHAQMARLACVASDPIHDLPFGFYTQ